MPGLLKANKCKSPWIIAHRGFRAKYPENTLIAFQAALNAGVTMIELDVTHTRDGELVVMHDNTLDRTTNGCGPVIDYSLKEVKKLDAGSWFNPIFASQHVPDLEEVLDLINGKVLVNIEIKPHTDAARYPSKTIERQVVEIINRKKIQDVVLISSFDRNILWHPSPVILTSDQVEAMHAEGLKVFPYNVDTPEQFEQMFDMHVDGLISNDPLLVIDWIKHNRAA
jgi:glycerophosphoryl diester phosphodiesterase